MARHHVDRRVAGERLVDGQRRIEARRLVLGEVLHHDLMALGARAAVGRLDAREHAHQRRLADAVRTDEGDAIAALDVHVDAVEDAPRAVGLGDAAQIEHRAAALRARRKREVDALALGRDLDRDDLVEHLDPALDLRRLGRLVAEAIDERLHPRDLVVLIALLLAQPLHPLFALVQVAAVVPGIVGQRAQADVGDARDDGVEEEAIVRDEDDGVRIVGEILLEPVAGLEIEVVRRLVEQQQTGPAEQELGERDAHLPAARERLGRLLHVLLREAEAAQDGVDLQVDAVALEPPEALLQIAVAAEHPRVLGLVRAVVGEPILERGDLGAHVEQRLERLPGFFDERPSRVVEAVLRQVADRQPRGLDDQPAVGLVEPGQHLEQCRLARAVRAAEADAFAVVDLPADGVEEDAVAERLAQVGELDHGRRSDVRDKRPILARAPERQRTASPESPSEDSKARVKTADYVAQGIAIGGLAP